MAEVIDIIEVGIPGPIGVATPELIQAATNRVDQLVPQYLPGAVGEQIGAEVAARMPSAVQSYAGPYLATQAATPGTAPNVAIVAAAQGAAATYLAGQPAVTTAAAAAVTSAIAGRSLVEGTDARLPQPAPGSEYTEEWVDANGLTFFAADVPTGTIHAPVFHSRKATLEEVNGVKDVTVSDEAGLAYGVMDVNGLLWEPTLVDLDGRHPQWVLDRMAERMTIQRATGFSPSYGPAQGVATPLVSGPDVLILGTSMGAGAGGSGYTVGTEISALTGLTHRNGSVGGENVTQITARGGSNPYQFVVEGGQIPESGPVNVTWRIDGGNGGGWPFLQGMGTGESSSVGVKGVLHARQLDGSVVKVPGTFFWVRDPGATQYQHSALDVYTFTRTTPGSVIAAPRPSAFIYDFATQRRNDIVVFWMARNNDLKSDATRQIVYDAHLRQIEYMAALDKRFLIIGEALGGSYDAGSQVALDPALVAGDNAYNAYMQSRWGRRFIDIHKYLVEFGLSDWGLSPTADDAYDIANNRVPRQLRIDSTHFNQYGYRTVGRLAVARMREFGWVA